MVRAGQINPDLIAISNDYLSEGIVLETPSIFAIPFHDSCANILATPGEGETVAEKMLFPYKDRQVPGESVEFEASSEPFAQYKLADGTTIKIKLVLLEAIRLVNEYNDATGDPAYLFKFQQIIGTLAPQELKRKVQ